ncbi:beta-hexosaminidase, variant [Coccidioides immitis RMSCC 3703]|uniref:Beta-hexosaminidase, variant n=1 Tax=Coccidioides immitis RMSCC 3703 TaxID=454286 RepID=A0A0J8RDI4_COCIT|nr:beta-hexosaminidase, variant [Coccidioides immitis RMSCC 3703]
MGDIGYRQMGQLFVMGFDGTSVDPQIRSLIEDYRLGSIILTAKNLKSAEETTKLVLELQTIARDAGHPAPLMIGLDQENGGVNSLFDEIYIRQFPSAMGIAATGSKSLAREVAKATAQELSAVGVNWILGPVLDVLNNARSQPLGVRSIGDDAQEVSAYGVEFMKGYQEAGLVTCGKHFPSYGNLEVLGNQTDVPVITDTLEQLSMSALVPFRNAIAQGIDSMMVGGCAMSSAGVNVMHACLSEQVVDDLLRKDLNFNGVVVSECLEMEALSFNIGVGGGTVMAMKAGCDLILLCRSFSVQQEAINGLRLGVENGIINKERIRQSVQRVLDMKARCTSWEKALNPAGISLLSQMQPSHTSLSTRAYNSSITIVRDKNNLLPLTSVLEPDEELLLLTPLVKPLPASAVSLSITESSRETVLSTDTVSWERSASVMSGESVFREFGRSLARHRNGRVLHTSYTANGVRPVHENLINRASGVIVVTADSNRNLYQYGFTKHVAMICNAQFAANGDRRSKPLVVVAVSSPYDFATDQSIGTYKIGMRDRDANALDELLTAIREDSTHNQRSALAGVTSNTFLLRNSDVEEAHFVVRNSSTQALYGFCSTYFFKSTGTAVIGALIVDPGRRKLSIGNSLHNRAIRSLMQRQGVRRFQLGSRLPGVYLGIPTGNPVERKRLRQWFASLGWNTSLSRPVCTMILPNLGEWTPPEGLTRTLKSAEVSYDLVYGLDYAEAILDHVKTNSRQGVMEIYKMALSGSSANGIIRAKRNGDDAILGSVVVYTSESTLAEFVPTVKEARPMGGGISSAVISPSAGEYSTIVQGLILLGIKQLRSQGASAVVLDCFCANNHPKIETRVKFGSARPLGHVLLANGNLAAGGWGRQFRWSVGHGVLYAPQLRGGDL